MDVLVLLPQPTFPRLQLCLGQRELVLNGVTQSAEYLVVP